jgi:hypothetical protein
MESEPELMKEGEPDTSKPLLIYFKTRGNAQLIRCVLMEAGVEYQ